MHNKIKSMVISGKRKPGRPFNTTTYPWRSTAIGRSFHLNPGAKPSNSMLQKLRYFEAVGGAHWNGDCFVFDQRVAVNPDLVETDVVVCFACREPLSLNEQASPDYVVGASCPYCVDRNDVVPVNAE